MIIRRFRITQALVTVLLLCTTAIGAGTGRTWTPISGPAPSPGQGESLERMLLRMRRAKDDQLAPLRAGVERVAAEFEELDAGERGNAAPALRARLVKLGAGVAPLLVPWLEPGAGRPPAANGAPDGRPGDAGPEIGAAQRFRAREFALALGEMPTPAVTDDLLRMAHKGTAPARRNSLIALSNSPEGERIEPVLRGIYATETGAMRRQALETLATLGGSEDLFVEALRADDDELVVTALVAITTRGNPAFAEQIMVLLMSDRGARHISAVVRYFRAAPEALDDDVLEGLAEVLLGNKLGADSKVELLDTLARLEVHLDGQLKKQLEPLTRSSSSPVAESALMLLARQRDNRARRLLLEPYDDAVSRTKTRPKAYSNRAHVYYRIGDLRAAIKDYKRALELGRNKGVDEAPFLGLARCYALQGNFKEAAEYLDRAPISVATLHALAEDPDFAEMVADKRGRKTFHLPEGGPER